MRLIDPSEPPFWPPYEPEEGDVIEREHPFTRMIARHAEFWETPAWEDRWWRPGAWDHDGYDTLAHAMGRVRFDVLCVARPPGYPRRILYTRQFTDPDGKVFKKSGLLAHAIGTFRQRIKPLRLGYSNYRLAPKREPVELREPA